MAVYKRALCRCHTLFKAKFFSLTYFGIWNSRIVIRSWALHLDWSRAGNTCSTLRVNCIEMILLSSAVMFTGFIGLDLLLSETSVCGTLYLDCGIALLQRSSTKRGRGRTHAQG